MDAAAVVPIVGGSATTADQLPQPLATQLLDTARDAFVAGFQLAAFTAALLMAGAAILIIAPGMTIRWNRKASGEVIHPADHHSP